MTGSGIFDADDGGSQHGFHFRLFKAQVGVHHFAVHKLQTLAVAQGLGADDGAVFKGDIFTVPGQIPMSLS